MKKSFALFAIVLLALSLGSSGGAVAKDAPRQFEFHAGDVFLNGFGFPLKNVARATHGCVATGTCNDTIEVIATGTLRVNGKKAEGTGSFAHKRGTATVAVGSFTAERLRSFTDLGTSTETPSTFHSGRAVILVHVVAHPAATGFVSTLNFDALLTIDCDLTETRPAFADGITLMILNGPFAGLAFDQKDPDHHGVTVFVAEAEED